MPVGAARSRALLVLALVAFGSACHRAPDRRVVYDLAERAPVAAIEAPWDLVRFGTPATELIEERGFVRRPSSAGDLSVAIETRATLPLILSAPERRRGILEVAAEPGFDGQVLEVDVNRSPVAHVRLTRKLRRVSFEIPAGIQRPGRNRFRFRIPSEEERRQAAPGGPPVARLVRLAVGVDGDPALLGLARPEAPAPLATLAENDRNLLVQAGPSRLSFALLAPQDAELRFLPGLHPGAPAATRLELRVTIRPEGGAERELWSAWIRSSPPPREVRIPLGVPAGAAVRLRLQVLAGSDPAHAWAVWGSPQVLGRGPGDPLEAAPRAQAPERGVEELRRSLAGTNVLLVVFDAARADHFGCYGYPRPTTPSLDRLAAEGVLFERHFTPAVFTYAAMGSIWSSRYPDEGETRWRPDGRLPADRLTLSELLASHGIRTAAFVTNPSAGPSYGLVRGFEDQELLYRPPWVERAMLPKAAVFREHLYPWLERHRQDRFFVYAHWREPHGPLDEPPLTGPDAPLPPEAHGYQWFRPVNAGRRSLSAAERDHLRRLYDGNLAYADREFGALRRKLEELGLWERTVVIATADHGEALLEHGTYGHNIQVYQESMHIPLIVRLPAGAVPAGRRVAGLSSLLDLAPTVADIFGLLGRGGSDRAFEGQSLLPRLVGAPGGPGEPGLVARTVTDVYGLVQGHHKLVFDSRDGHSELYDLGRDPAERVDRSATEPIRAAAYREALELWLMRVRRPEGRPVETARPDADDLKVLRALGYVK